MDNVIKVLQPVLQKLDRGMQVQVNDEPKM